MISRLCSPRLISFLLRLSLCSLVVASAATAEHPLAHRQPDPVVVTGSELGATLLGRPIASLRLLASSESGGELTAVPFQIDERTVAGEFVLTAGLGASADVDGRRLDGNDELVFLARDAGARTHQPPPGAEFVSEIALNDPQNGSKAWVYLAAYPERVRPPRSRVRYIDFDPNANRISTDAYQLGFTDPDRPFTPTWTSRPGADGDAGIDYLDSVKVRLSGRLFGLTQVSRTDLDFESIDRGYLLGPIRLVRVLESRLRLVGKLSAPGAEVVRIYYPDWIDAPIPISLPFKLSAFFSGLYVFFGNDFDLPRDGSHRYYSDHFPYGIPIGAQLTDAVDVAAPPLVPSDEVAWHGVAGPLGAVLSAIRLPASVPVSVETVFEMNDEVDEPEDVRGVSPLVGRRLVGWENVPKGRHVAHFYDFFPITYHPGDEQKFIRMLADPVTASVTSTRTELSQTGLSSPESDGGDASRVLH